MYQRFHHYVPRFDYIAGLLNHMADAFSRNFQLTWPNLFSQLSTNLSQKRGF